MGKEVNVLRRNRSVERQTEWVPRNLANLMYVLEIIQSLLEVLY